MSSAPSQSIPETESVLEEALNNSLQLNSDLISELISSLSRLSAAMIDSYALLSDSENSKKTNWKNSWIIAILQPAFFSGSTAPSFNQTREIAADNSQKSIKEKAMV